MTRKRVGAGLLEAFSQQCECCNGRGVIVTLDAPAEPAHRASAGTVHRPVPVPAPPSHAPGNGNGKGQGSGSGGGRGGNANGRRGSDRRGGYAGPAQDSAAPAFPRTDTGPADTQADTQADTAQADTAQAGGVPAAGVPAGVGSAPGGNGTAAEDSGAPRARRSTAAAGRAFATAVLVDDEPALVPVVPTAHLVTEPPAAAATAGDTATDAPPVRRTRAGSAVARVTVTADPQPAARPETPAAVPDAEAEALAFPADEAPRPEPEPVAEPAAASVAEPVIVPASVFEAMPASADAEPAAHDAAASPAQEPATGPEAEGEASPEA
jgi:ribonuclease E